MNKNHPNQTFRIKIEDLIIGSEATVVETGEALESVIDAIRAALLGVGFAEDSVNKYLHDAGDETIKIIRENQDLQREIRGLKEKATKDFAELQKSSNNLMEIKRKLSRLAKQADNGVIGVRQQTADLLRELHKPGTPYFPKVVDVAGTLRDQLTDLHHTVNRLQELWQR